MHTGSSPILITKLATDRNGARRRSFYFPNARGAFKAALEQWGGKSKGSILLPSYIGWSPREGSGVFDPVNELGIPVQFYRLDRGLQVDLSDFRRLLRTGDVSAVLLIHYFGFVDPSYAEMVRLAREAGVLILEDEAHAMLTDLVGGISGRLGDASFFSLHKMLPVSDGGLLLLNNNRIKLGELESESISNLRARSAFGEFDLLSISNRRRENARCLTSLLLELSGEVEPLFPVLTPNTVPQTYPIVLRRAPRNRVYELMNESGFGVVSLYHTLIEPLRVPKFADSLWLSERILNLPVHQDTTPEKLGILVERLKVVIQMAL